MPKIKNGTCQDNRMQNCFEQNLTSGNKTKKTSEALHEEKLPKKFLNKTKFESPFPLEPKRTPNFFLIHQKMQ